MLSLRILAALALALYLFTALSNFGMVAWDDYQHVIGQFLPVPARSMATIVAEADFRSPMPVLYLHGFARLAHALGLTSPVAQLHFTLACLALIAALAFSFFAPRFVGDTEGGAERKRLLAAGLVLFYFASPFFFTRAMYESIAAPYLFASAAFAAVYYRTGRLAPLAGALLTLGVASLFRFQAGVCWAALAAVVALRRSGAQLAIFLGLSILLFLAVGLVDIPVRGEFHGSLRRYYLFNASGGSSGFRSGPFYQYLLLFLAFTVPPAFFARYRGFSWKKEYAPWLPALLYFGVFVLAHSVIARKDERFMIPILPVFLVLLTPLAYFLTSEMKRLGWRGIYFTALNGLLLGIVVLNVPQRATLEAAFFLDRKPAIGALRLVGNIMSLFPTAFISHSVTFQRVAEEKRETALPANCSEALGVPKAQESWIDGGKYVKLAGFEASWIERVLITLNRRQNEIRQSFSVYGLRDCARP